MVTKANRRNRKKVKKLVDKRSLKKMKQEHWDLSIFTPELKDLLQWSAFNFLQMSESDVSDGSVDFVTTPFLDMISMSQRIELLSDFFLFLEFPHRMTLPFTYPYLCIFHFLLQYAANDLDVELDTEGGTILIDEPEYQEAMKASIHAFSKNERDNPRESVEDWTERQTHFEQKEWIEDYQNTKKAKKVLKQTLKEDPTEIYKDLLHHKNDPAKRNDESRSRVEMLFIEDPPRTKREIELMNKNDGCFAVRKRIKDAFFANPTTKNLPVKCSEYSLNEERFLVMLGILISEFIPKKELIYGDARSFGENIYDLPPVEMKRNQYQYQRAKEIHDQYFQNFSLGAFRKKSYILRALLRGFSYFRMLGPIYLTDRKSFEEHNWENMRAKSWMPFVDLYHEQILELDLDYGDLHSRFRCVSLIPNDTVGQLVIDEPWATLEVMRSLGADSMFWTTNDDHNRYSGIYSGHMCLKCGKFGDAKSKLKTCAKCKTAFYCSRKCQKDHWKDHKADCKLWRKLSSKEIKEKIKPKGRLWFSSGD